jgi:hypothetical protein
MQQQQMGMVVGQDRSSNLPALFDAWGLGYDPTQLAGDLELAISVRAGAQRPEVVPYVIWLNVGADQMTDTDPVTGNLTRINIASAGVLTTTDESPAALEPLITTSDQSGLVPVASLQGGFVDPKTILNSFFTDGESRTLAARVTGTVPTAFPDGPPTSMNTENPDEVGPADPDAATDPDRHPRAPPRRIHRRHQRHRRRRRRSSRGRGMGPRTPPRQHPARLRHPRRQRRPRPQRRRADGGQPRPPRTPRPRLVRPPLHAHRTDATGSRSRVPRQGADPRGRDRTDPPADHRPPVRPHRDRRRRARPHRSSRPRSTRSKKPSSPNARNSARSSSTSARTSRPSKQGSRSSTPRPSPSCSASSR